MPESEMGEESSTYGEIYIQGFGGKTWGKETNWKILAWIGE